MIALALSACVAGTSTPPGAERPSSSDAAAPGGPADRGAPSAEGPAPIPVVPGPDLVGLCDASAAVVSGPFLVVADDERNRLRVFDSTTFAPAGTIELGALSPLLAGKKEGDLEGAAAAADGTVWFTGSHDSGTDTEPKPSRQRLFAVKLATGADGKLAATLAYGPTDQLIEQGKDTNQLRDIVVTTVGRTSKDPRGLSIEGLATGPAGSLLVGFRAPVHDDKALLVRLDDPVGLAGGGVPAITGPRWIPLGGRGIRSLEQDGDGWLILAGPSDGGDDFALFRWAGFDDNAAPVRLPVAFGALTPEALVRIGEAWWVLSDDGREVSPSPASPAAKASAGTERKDLPEPQRRARTARIPTTAAGGPVERTSAP